MKVAVWYNLPSGGAKRALFDHVDGLLKLGHSVEAWCPPTADQTYLPLAGLVREHVVPLDWPTSCRLSDTWQLTLDMSRKARAMDAHCRACADQIHGGGFDVVLANSCRFFGASALGRFVALPSVLYLQEPYRRLYEAMPNLVWAAQPEDTRPWWNLRRQRSVFSDVRDNRNNRRQARYEVDNAAAYDRILVNSHFSRESLLRCYGLDSAVCYLGINTERFHPPSGARGDYVVSLGEMQGHKNPEFIVNAIASMPEPRPRLVWVSNVATSYGDTMRSYAAGRGVDLDVRTRVGDSELCGTLGHAAVMAYAPRLEPFGFAPLEANACGTPAVAVAEGGVRETVADGVTGLLVDNDPGAMGDAIRRLLGDPALARRLGDQAREAVERHWNGAGAARRLEAALMRHAPDAVP